MSSNVAKYDNFNLTSSMKYLIKQKFNSGAECRPPIMLGLKLTQQEVNLEPGDKVQV